VKKKDMLAIRVRYGLRETGWAELLSTEGESRIARIDNVPFGPCEANFDSVVRVTQKGVITDVISTRYPVRVTVEYWEPHQFYKFQAIMSIVGGVVEGAVEPHGGKSGHMTVAARAGIDPVAVAKGLGFSTKPEPKEQTDD
jgi:hypothetical protein